MLRRRSWRQISSALQVDFEDGRFLVLAALAARIHVDGDERFGFIDHDVAAAPSGPDG